MKAHEGRPTGAQRRKREFMVELSPELHLKSMNKNELNEKSEGIEYFQGRNKKL